MLKSWPAVPGRYATGDRNSCVAVCTLASIDLIEKLSDKLDKIALVGKVVTENIGIEKIVQNIITNPNIRFLILCGKESYGHYTGQAITALVNNGVNKDGKIMGAKGPLAILKNLKGEQIQTFRRQVKIINLIDCCEIDKISNQINECVKNNPGQFKSKIKVRIMKPITAWHDEKKDVVLDPKGFFTIFVDKKAKQIRVEHYLAKWKNLKYSGDWKKCMSWHKLNKIIVGKDAEAICHTIIREGLISRIEHAAYLGRELKKAEIALKKNLIYEQDKELEY